MEEENVPKLRFRENNDDNFVSWKTKSFSDIADFKKGSLLSKADISEDGAECVLYGELYTKYSEIITTVISKTNIKGSLMLSKSGDILIPSSGETAVDISTASCLLLDGIILGGDMNICRLTNDDDGRFVSYQLNHIRKYDIAKIAQGSSVVHLYSSNLRSLKLYIPSLPEQTKIANFFSTLDSVIEKKQEKIKALEEQKKGYMQRIFSQELRFRGDDGGEYPEWDEKKLGDISQIIGGGTPETVVPSYWNGDINWFTPTEIGKHKYAFSSLRKITIEGFKNSSAKLLPEGTILLTSRATLGEMAILKTKATTNQGCQSIIPNKDISADFIYYCHPLIKRFCYKHASGSTFLEISKKELEKMPLFVPSLPEQTKIANFFSAFDSVIEKEKKELELWKIMKKGLMQQMFV